MPLIANNIVIIDSKSSQASAPVVNPTTYESLRASVSKETPVRRPDEKIAVKKDRKSSSAYLLDMVTIDEL